MAEGYEAYHVPQQSRRDKLRDQLLHHHHHHLVAHNQDNNNAAHLLHPPLPPPLYDAPSSSDFLPKHHSSNFTGFISPNYMDSANSSNLPTLNPTDTSIHSQSPNPFLNFHPSPATGALLFKPEPLSLSLSTSHHNQQHQHQQQQHHNGLNFQSYVLPTTGINVAGGGDAVASRCSVDVLPLGPFTGYASVLKGSRFLNPAQQLLEEFCDVVGGGILIPAGEKIAPDPSLLDPPLDDVDPLSYGSSEFGAESRRKKSRLISMLDEVYRRYKQYYQQMEAVVTSFECVAGLGNAAPYANLALKAMSKHFRSLKNAITDQLSKASLGKDDHALASSTVKLGSYGITRHNGQSSGLIEHHQPVWRPQRGLPERAVTVLRAWLFEHFLHPYPTDTDKLMLAKQTGLSRSQVSNWFINARVRLWKPMVEEIHTLETRQAKKAAHKDDHQRNKATTTDHHQQPPYSNSDAAAGGSNPSTSSQPAFDVPIPKRTRNELPPSDHMSVGSNEDHQQHQHQHQQLYNNTSNNNMQSYGGEGFSDGHLGMEAGGGGVVGGVSLTLGLHQHHHQGIGFLEPPPFSITSVAAQRFGLDTGGVSEGYNVMGGGSGFDSPQNRNFGRDVMGGQLLHDFVG